MTLVPIEPGPGAGAALPTLVAGRIAVTLSPERRQFLGVRSEPLRARPLTRTIRTVGRVAVDERRLHHVHTKFEGYVEHLHVDFTGKLVRKGEPLLSIFSPELVATQQEYVLAYRAQRELAGSGIASLTAGTAELLEAARRRLLLWDIRAEDIARLERTGEVERTLDLHAEIGGYVVQKNVYHGMRVMPADTLFDIADLSRLWVLADVYESDLPSVRLGMRARLELPYLPGRVWTGTVTNVAPTVEEKTRTIKLRVEVANQDDALKPDMFADVFLQADLGRGVAVPENALIRSGDRTLVFLDRGEGRFEPREVSIGSPVNGSFQVLSGVTAGDRVVTSANFLIDSESSLRAALAGMSSGDQCPAPAHQH
jgi:Cu(I)/Ag(I) efflux system membrane fusion protein